MKCEHEGCQSEGEPCYLDDEPDEPNGYFCAEHAHAAGFCYLCGQFWGGIESFDFRPSRLCDNCESQMQDDGDDYEEDYEPDYDDYADYEE